MLKIYSFRSERHKGKYGSEGIGPVDGCKWTASFSDALTTGKVPKIRNDFLTKFFWNSITPFSPHHIMVRGSLNDPVNLQKHYLHTRCNAYIANQE